MVVFGSAGNQRRMVLVVERDEYVILSFAKTLRRHSLCKKHVILNRRVSGGEACPEPQVEGNLVVG